MGVADNIIEFGIYFSITLLILALALLVIKVIQYNNEIPYTFDYICGDQTVRKQEFWSEEAKTLTFIAEIFSFKNNPPHLVSQIFHKLNRRPLPKVHYKQAEIISKCSVCKLAIFASEDILTCPFCGAIAHEIDLLEWIKIKGYCPNCYHKINYTKTDQNADASIPWNFYENPNEYSFSANHESSGLTESTSLIILKKDNLHLSLAISAVPIGDPFDSASWVYKFQATLSEDRYGFPREEIIFFEHYPTSRELGRAITDQNGRAELSLILPEVPYNLKFRANFRGDELYEFIWTSSTTVSIPGTFIAMMGPTTNLNLYVYDFQGRHVGMNRKTSQVEVEIPGAYSSGDIRNGMEWIYLPPHMIDYYIVIDTRKSRFSIEDYNLTITSMTPENVLAQVSFTETIQAGDINTWLLQTSPTTGKVIGLSGPDFIIQQLELLSATIMQLNAAAFDKNPRHRKSALIHKIQKVIRTVEIEGYWAYDELLHDIKPKLTGLKTTEKELPWNHGIYKHPWVIDPPIQALLRAQCNKLLCEIKSILQFYWN